MSVREGAKRGAQVGISILWALLLYFGPMGPLLLSLVHFDNPFIHRILRDIEGKDDGSGLGGGDERYIDLPKFDLPEMQEAVEALQEPPKGEEAPPEEAAPDEAAPDAGADAVAPPAEKGTEPAAEKPGKKPGPDGAEKPGEGKEPHWRNQGKIDAIKNGTTDPATGGHGKAAPCEADDPRVRTVGNVTEIDRSAVEFYSTHLAELDALGDAGTHRNVDGKVDGFRVGLGRCGFLYEAGFRNGDIVHAVNDTPIYNVVDAARAYLKLRTQSRFEVRISRKRHLMILKFRVV